MQLFIGAQMHISLTSCMYYLWKDWKYNLSIFSYEGNLENANANTVRHWSKSNHHKGHLNVWLDIKYLMISISIITLNHGIISNKHENWPLCYIAFETLFDWVGCDFGLKTLNFCMVHKFCIFCLRVSTNE